jgi:N-acetylmuramoyl-L-alanine amidase
MFCACAFGQTFEEKVVAAVIMGEAWGEGTAGMAAVAEVIHRRSVMSRRTPFQVVTQGSHKRMAFSCLAHATPTALVAKFARKPDYRTRALPLAQALAKWPASRSGITRCATHFTRKEEKPYWAKGHAPVAVIGDHAFYRLRLP